MEQLSESSKAENPYKASPGENMELAEDADQLRDQVNSMFSTFEKQFRAERPMLWWATLLSPLILTLAVLGLLAVVQGPGYALSLIHI